MLNQEHYYGDFVRRLFFLGGVVMILGLPLMSRVFSLPLYIPLLVILALAYLAGLTSPRHPAVMWFNLVVATAAFVVFELFAIRLFTEQNSFLFVANQIQALIFLVAIYYSVKTIRSN